MQLETAVSIKDKEQNLLIEQLRKEVSALNLQQNDSNKAHALEVISCYTLSQFSGGGVEVEEEKGRRREEKRKRRGRGEEGKEEWE